MINRRSYRTLIIFGTIFGALLVLFFVPQTGIREKSARIASNLIKGSSSSANTAKLTDPKDEGFNEDKWFFQLPMPEYELPKFDKSVLEAAPINWRGPGHDTFATFYASRSRDLHDPYFLAAQQIVFRLLWNPRTKTEKLPMTVFVAPFVPEEERDFFRGAGAIVRELPLRPFVPTNEGVPMRLMDMFSKIEMWYQLDFKRIAYVDSDAFPNDHIDSIFDLVPSKQCNRDLLPEGDTSVADEICEYTFGGWRDVSGINAGVMVFNPSEPMYGRLIRESLNKTAFDNGYMEQSMLNHAYAEDGPFPPTGFLNRSWNAGPDYFRDYHQQYIIHHKLWATGFDPADVWHKNEFKHMWWDMIEFYKTDEFKQHRMEAGLAAHS